VGSNCLRAALTGAAAVPKVGGEESALPAVPTKSGGRHVGRPRNLALPRAGRIVTRMVIGS
jgi:hypothetical protein